jgi:hypothetical protein
MLSVLTMPIMLSDVMLNVVMLNAIMLSVVAPQIVASLMMTLEASFMRTIFLNTGSRYVLGTHFCLVTYNGPNKVECLPLASLFRLT